MNVLRNIVSLLTVVVFVGGAVAVEAGQSPREWWGTDADGGARGRSIVGADGDVCRPQNFIIGWQSQTSPPLVGLGLGLVRDDVGVKSPQFVVGRVPPPRFAGQETRHARNELQVSGFSVCSAFLGTRPTVGGARARSIVGADGDVCRPQNHEWWATEARLLAATEDTAKSPVYIDADSVGARVPPADLTAPPGANVRAEGQKKERHPFYKGPTGALLKSVIFPGWGQFSNGKKVKAGIIFAVESYFIFKAIRWRGRTNDRLTLYDETKNIDDWNYYDNARSKRDTFYWLLAGTVFISMWDAYADAHFKPYEKVKDDPEFWSERLRAPRPADEISATILSLRY